MARRASVVFSPNANASTSLDPERLIIRHHNLQSGTIDYCQVCGSTNLKLIIDLGHQPLCIAMLRPEQLNQPETLYPLRYFMCQDCSLAQINYIVPPEALFFPDYPYLSGITNELATHLRGISRDVVSRTPLGPDHLAVDIGSNDGTLLSGFKERNVRVVGVEPTNVAAIARSRGIDTIQSFFSEKVAQEIVATRGKASVVTATNVFAHIQALGETIRGILALLTDDGVFVAENHYLLNIVEEIQYDSLYHEHLRSYSLKSLITLFQQYGCTVVDAERVASYGGSLRTYVMKGATRPVSDNVAALLEVEKNAGLHSGECYPRFRSRIQKSRARLLRLAFDAADQGRSLVGNSCPGRATILLNYCGIDASLMPYIAEQPTSLKLGMYLPGRHIPVVNNSILFEEQPDYVVLLAWHYGQSIRRQLREKGLRSKLIMPLPDVVVYDD